MKHLSMDPIRVLQSYLKRKKIDALLVSHPENRRYLSGYSAHDSSINESSGFLLVFAKFPPILLTDFRFLDHARAEVGSLDIMLYPKGLMPLLSSLFKKFSIKTFAYEPYYFLHSTYNQLVKACKKSNVSLVDFSQYLVNMRQQKTKNELLLTQKSVELNEKVFSEIYRTLKPGLTEVEVALSIENAMRLNGAERPSFDTIVASGPNGALPHAVPGSRKIKKNEPIIIDMGLVLDGYCSDMTRTIVLDKPDHKTVNIVRIVRKAQLKALAVLKPGVACKTVDKAARDVITDEGYGPQFGHSLGHGVGLAVHEAPSLSSRNKRVLKEGMVVTVEPGIYISGWGGVRLENMAALTKDGYQLFNADTTFLDL